MKKKSLTKIVSFCLTFLFIFSLVILPRTNLAKAVIENAQIHLGQMTNKATTTPSEYHIANHYSYRLDKALTKTPDTFEAWVNVPANSTGGVIMSNFIENDRNYNDTYVDYSIDVSGRVRLDWATKVIIFKNGFVADGQWHHIAVVRNTTNSTFTLYVDGKENTIASVFNTKNPVSERPFSIGIDLNMESKERRPLNNGRIKQITIYNGAISAERVKQDMNNTAISTNDTNATLLTNVYLGEPWTKRIVTDTSKNGINAQLSSYEKLVKLADPGAYDYSILVIPDVQTTVHWKSKATHVNTAPYISNEPPATYDATTGKWSTYDTSDNTVMAQWIKWLKSTPSKYNTKFAVQVGDLSDYGQYEIHYKWSSYYMSQLYGSLPWSFCQGNHDYDLNCNNVDARLSTYYNKYFPYALYSKQAAFGGAMEGTSMSNTYYRYEISGVKYLVINMEFGPRLNTLRWAGRLCEQFADHRVILNTHGYMDPDGSIFEDGEHYSPETYAWNAATEVHSGRFMFEELVKKYANIFLVVNGHMTAEDIVMRTDTGIHGNKITSLLVDFQTAEYLDSGAGTEATCIMFFNEAEKTINLAYYSAYYDAVYNVHNQFRISFADPNNPTIGA